MKAMDKAWKYEEEHHLGDYGGSDVDLEYAFRAGWEASKRDTYRRNTIKYL